MSEARPIALWRWIALALGPSVALWGLAAVLAPLAAAEADLARAFTEAIMSDTAGAIETYKAQRPLLRVNQIMPIGAMAAALALSLLIPTGATVRATTNGLTTLLTGLAIGAVMVVNVRVEDADAWLMFFVIAVSVTGAVILRRILAARVRT
ncbi:hypothetical protein SAMN05444339_1038 [Loktanella atrilutea]|uniref:Uncharacterized protein n=1 Tax=Loktanella atrilutea TaxID=366533 RepID=A0A1M4Y5Y2_LOKAT|nr:hypothetical protein [Loktanella atrilutea]SHF01118.1 hypothetical protein SAMN05444339_1038 [Loktanella atrilutea]